MVRDQEAGGSNPLAPTILFLTAYTLIPSEKWSQQLAAAKDPRVLLGLAFSKIFGSFLSYCGKSTSGPAMSLRLQALTHTRAVWPWTGPVVPDRSPLDQTVGARTNL